MSIEHMIFHIILTALHLFQICDIIAKGAYGNVLRVRREDEKQYYAMKVSKYM